VSPVERLFDRFVTAFATLKAANVAELFATPGVALGRTGTIVALTTRDDLLRYYQTALDRYRDSGCVSCGWSNLETVAMGRGATLATVTWHLLKADGALVATWRQSYALALDGAEPLIYASAMHVE
jgi:hypothetical protein